MPAAYQGTVFRSGASPILNLRPPEGMTAQRQRHTLDFLQKMNEMDTLDGDSEMAARISSYELAFRMQSEATGLVNFSDETSTTRALYGLDQDASSMLDEVLKTVAAKGRTVVMTSHDLARAEDLATRFDILSRGVISASASLTELKKTNLLTFYKQALAA